MTQTIDTPAWGTTTDRPPSSIPRPARIVLMAIGGLIGAMVVAIVIVGPNEKPAGPGIYAAPGWSAWKISELTHNLKRDDGMAEAEADCVMRTIVGGTTWLEWQAMGAGGQLRAIRSVERSC